MPRMQLREEARGIVDVAAWIEHVLNAAELIAVIAMIDLHAAEIDQRLAFAPRSLEGKKCFRAGAGKDSFPLYIQGIGL